MKRKENENKSEIAQIISDKLEKLERNQAWLARKSGVTSTTIYNIVTRSYAPSLPTLKKISQALGLNCIKMIAILVKEDGGED